MKAKRNKIKNVILGVLAALTALAMALLPVLLRSAKPGEEDAASILHATAERGSIRTTISGGGALSGADAKKISLPHGVEVTEYLVKNGQAVEAGEPLAAVDKTTVMQTIATVQKNLDYLDSQMGASGAEQTRTTLQSPVAGRVKAVYAAPCDAVTDVMQAQGALLVVSLDGCMAVQVETPEEAPIGSEITVTLQDGTAYPGRVERRQENTLTVTLTDNGPALGAPATLTTAEGVTLGEGELYVHSAWNLTAASGTVKEVYVKAGDKVQRGYGLCYLENMDGTGRFDQLSAQRREYEQTLEQLFTLYETGAVAAPEDGIVAGVDEAKVGLMRAGAGEFTLSLLDAEEVPTDPNHEPTGALRKRAAVVSKVSFGSITLLADQTAGAMGSYSIGTEPDYASAETVILTGADFAGAPVYAFDSASGTWSLSSPNKLETVQLVYLVYNNDSLLWVLIPFQPLPPEEDMGGWFGGGGGAAEPFEMYDLSQTEIMRLTPRGDMTVKVKIDEMDILSVKPGQEAEITLDALPGRSFVGRVLEIDPKGVNSGGRTRYTVTIAVDREESLLSGMNATAILTVGVTEDILTIPVAALTEKGSRTVVYTAYDPQHGELLLPVEVETGLSDGVNVEILSGLTEGMPVFYAYYETEAMPELAALPGVLT